MVYRPPPIYTDRLMIRVTPGLARAIEAAAEKNRVSVSEYVRSSILIRSKADGVDVSDTA
jgi:predicted HicB family RNase H-like nuclease